MGKLEIDVVRHHRYLFWLKMMRTFFANGGDFVAIVFHRSVVNAGWWSVVRRILSANWVGVVNGIKKFSPSKSLEWTPHRATRRWQHWTVGAGFLQDPGSSGRDTPIHPPPPGVSDLKKKPGWEAAIGKPLPPRAPRRGSAAGGDPRERDAGGCWILRWIGGDVAKWLWNLFLSQT